MEGKKNEQRIEGSQTNQKKKEKKEEKVKVKKRHAIVQIGNTLVRLAATFIRTANGWTPFQPVFNWKKAALENWQRQK